MGVELRGGRLYYYRAVRGPDGRVQKRYVARGELAIEAARADEETREAQRAAVLEHRARVAKMKAETATLASSMAELDAAVAGALRGAGWHSPSRAWRLKRKGNDVSTAVATIGSAAGMSWETDALWAQAGAVDRSELRKAAGGDRTAMKTANAFLAHPAGRALFGDVTRRVLEEWARLFAEGDPVTERAVLLQAGDLREKLAGEAPNALDLLLAERVVVAWLFVVWAEKQFAAALTRAADPQQSDFELTPAVHAVFAGRVEMGQRWLLSAARALAKVKKSKLPDVLAVLNVGPRAKKKPAGRKITVGANAR